VKAKVEKPQVERGWQGIANRQQIEAEMKKENPKNISEPTFQPQKDRRAGAASAAGQNAAQPNEARNATQTAPGSGNDQQAERAARRMPRDNRGQDAGPGEPANSNNGAEQAQKEKQAGMNDLQAENEKNQEAKKVHDLQAERAQQVRRAMEAQRADRARRAAQAQESERANRAAQAQQAQQAQKQAAEHPQSNQMRPVQQAPPPDRAQQHQQQTHRPEQASPPQPQGGNQDTDAEHKNKKKKPGEEPSPHG
jgi:hypothetical protein